ncbi:MAG: response regulator transcription factor [Algicola sp.]|nr:response regulator transcription factor [Algicola sp.]
MTINVLLVDDQTLVRQGIQSLLSLSDKVEVIAQASDGSEVLGAVVEHKPDVILLDIRMPRQDGIATLEQLKAENITTPVIILTTFDDHEVVLQGIKAGAKGYLLKDVSLDCLVDAIEKVHQGETLVKPAITDTVLQGLSSLKSDFASYDKPEALTAKETQVLRLMAGGYSNKEIADAMFKSQGTIKNQVSTILAKLGVRDRTRAVLKAIELGFI